VGDSFVEASMLDPEDRPGAQLERALGARPVFAAGSPGTALLDYAERIRFLHERLQVQDFVILMERNDVLQSLCGSGNIHGPCLDSKTLKPRVETLPSPSTSKRLLRNSALAQYLVSQLAFDPKTLWDRAFPASPHALQNVTESRKTEAKANPNPLKPDTLTPAVDAVTRAFFERVKPHVGGRLVIVLDCNRTALYAGKDTSDPARSRFMALARAAGAIVIDTEPLVRAHLARSALKLDVGPYDAHLNQLGVELYTQAAAAVLGKP